MSDRSFLFVRLGLRYTSQFLVMWREPLISSTLYVGLMEVVSEVGIVVGTFDRMTSSMVAVVGSY